MIRLRIGYLITGIITGLLLVLSFFATIPDGKLHIVFCDVGQGDGIYIRFPDGKDMVVDGGPGNKIISCLSRHMPFWDRTIDVALLTHPEKDHLNGLLSVLERYQILDLVRSDVANTTEGFVALTQLVKEKHIHERLVATGEIISAGSVTLSVVWPTKEQIAYMKPMKGSDPAVQGQTLQVLGTSTLTGLNDASIVFSLSYGIFDALFPGDADSVVQPRMMQWLSHAKTDGVLELLKVPHHGSKSGMTDGFLCIVGRCHLAKQGDTLKKPLAVLSVGKNSYGHPAPEIVQKLESSGFQVLRTDQAGDIEVVSDGKEWQVRSLIH
jgi:competence protein ComEC